MRTFLLFLFGFFLMACNNNSRNGRNRRTVANDVYYEYQVWAEEGSPTVTVTLQCMSYGGDGPGMKLTDSASVLLDGEPMPGDSSVYNGTIYQKVRPAAGFDGSHTVDFVDDNGKAHKETFAFEPFSLAEELPEQLKKVPFVIKLKNFPAASKKVQLVLTDTSFTSRDVNEDVLVENGEIHVTARQLENLVAGPVSLLINSEYDKPLKDSPKASGRIQLLYSLRREIELMN